MGIGYNELCFLKHVYKTNGKFGTVALIGRQSIAIDKKNQEKILGTSYSGYCEKLLIEQFGASKVDSYDVNDYENSTHIFNFNLPFDSKEKYDCVIDFGTLEHIFDIKTALINIFNLTKINGSIMHANPVNMYPGHGLYQFGLDFYSSYYKNKCFKDLRIFLANYEKQKNYWFELIDNRVGAERFIFSDTFEIGALVYVKKLNENKSFEFNQSDYEQIFSESTLIKKSEKKKTIYVFQILKKINFFIFINSIYGKFLNSFFNYRTKFQKKLKRNKNFKKFYF